MPDPAEPQPLIDAQRAAPPPVAATLLPTRPRSGDPPRRKAHHRDLVRLDRYFALVRSGVPDDEAVRRTVCDPGIGLREYVLDPTRIDRIGEVARARARLFRWAAPEQLERVAAEATARLASSAGGFVEVIEEVAAGDGLSTSDDAQVARARVEAAKFGLGVCGVAPKPPGGATTTVNVLQNNAAAVAEETQRAAAVVGERLRFLTSAVERLMAACPDTALVDRIVAQANGLQIHLEPCSGAEVVPRTETA